jgi:transposase
VLTIIACVWFPTFSSRSEFLAKAHTYQLYFNLVRPNSHKQNLSPWQIRVPQDHSLRPLRVMTDEALRELQPRFHKLYARTGRPSIAPEKLLWALLLQALYSVRSERLLMEQLDYNLLFRWFVGLNMDDAIWDVTVFPKNRERLRWDMAEAFFQAVLQQAREWSLLSDEHFAVDRTLLEAWASVKSYQRKDGQPTAPPNDPGNATVDLHGEKRRTRRTHRRRTWMRRWPAKARAKKPS